MDMNLSKLQEIVKDREIWLAAVYGFTKSGTHLATEQNTNTLDTETLISMFCVSDYH